MNRTTRRGGGVSTFFKGCFKCEMFNKYSTITDDFEVLTSMYAKKHFSVCYRHPNGRTANLFDYLEMFLSFASENRFNLICCGDFNRNTLANNYLWVHMYMVIDSNECANAITIPTRVMASTIILLDLFIKKICCIGIQVRGFQRLYN